MSKRRSSTNEDATSESRKETRLDDINRILYQIAKDWWTSPWNGLRWTDQLRHLEASFHREMKSRRDEVDAIWLLNTLLDSEMYSPFVAVIVREFRLVAVQFRSEPVQHVCHYEANLNELIMGWHANGSTPEEIQSAIKVHRDCMKCCNNVAEYAEWFLVDPTMDIGPLASGVGITREDMLQAISTSDCLCLISNRLQRIIDDWDVEVDGVISVLKKWECTQCDAVAEQIRRDAIKHEIDWLGGIHHPLNSDLLSLLKEYM